MAAPTSRTEYRSLLVAKLGVLGLPTEIQLDATDQDSILDEAVEEFSHDHPWVVVDKVVGDGTTRRHVLDTVNAAWSEGFSSILKLRLHSATDTDDPGIILTPTSYSIIQSDEAGTTKTVLLMVAAHSADRDLSFEATYPHDIDSAPITIPPALVLALGNLAASIGAIWIAERASDQRDTSINADAVDYGSLADKFSERSRNWRDLYEKTVPADEKRAAGAWVPAISSSIRRGRLTTHHPSQVRP